MHLSKKAQQCLPWLLLAGALIATAAIYWPGVTGGWVFDDYPNIVDNSAIHILPGHSKLAAWVNAALSSPSSFLHRPLASITFALNWMAGGGDPWPFKVTNIVIHLINGVLVFCMLRALLRLVALRGGIPPAHSADSLRSEGSESSDGSRISHPLSARRVERLRTRANRDEGDGFPGIDDRATTRLALIVSAAWLLLPINLMAVLYVVQRMESLCQIFVLAGLWAYLHGRWMMLIATDARRDRYGFALAVSGIVLGTLLGLTSKETAALLPLFAFLVEWVVLRFTSKIESNPLSARKPSPNDSNSHPRDRRLGWTFVITMFVPAVLGVVWQLKKALAPAAYAGRDFTLVQRLLTEPRVLVDYLHWTLLPNPNVLSLYHDEIVPSTGLLTPWTTLASIVFLAALIGVAIWLRKRRPLVSLGIGWFFAAQLLTATFVPLELVYEQRMYFASIGVLLAVGSLLLGLRWKITLPLLRGFLVVVALLWFAVATNLRANEWSNPLKLAVAEANRHPESPRAVYEAGRLLLIASNYQPGKARDNAWKYLREAAAIPGASALPDQAMIMLADHREHGDDAAFWQSMSTKLRDQPTRQEDISALISLTNCYTASICRFDPADLDRAYQAVLSRPHPIARLNGAYADFQRDILHNDTLAIKYLALAVKGDPSEPAYRIDLTALYARNGQTEKALEQIDALRRMNYAGRLDRQISILEQMAEQGKSPKLP